MTRRLDFFFDFTSPFAYFALNRVEVLAEEYDLDVAWTPVLLWAVRQHFGMVPPMEDGPKADYIPADMARSAAFYDVPFRLPDTFGKSTHLAARLFYGLADRDRQVSYTKAVFRAHFSDNADIADPETLAGMAASCGIGADEAKSLATADSSKEALAASVQHAIDRKVWGSPFFILDNECFFGVDRLPQIEWRLKVGRSQ
ncbi:MAG: 2-hydroxychromene-2-carboxylate isomerase [Alphaproteobacteria bacterium]